MSATERSVILSAMRRGFDTFRRDVSKIAESLIAVDERVKHIESDTSTSSIVSEMKAQHEAEQKEFVSALDAAYRG